MSQSEHRVTFLIQGIMNWIFGILVKEQMVLRTATQILSI